MKLALTFALSMVVCSAQITIGWTPQQQIDGIGSAVAFSEVATYNDWNTKGATFWFNTLGFSILRIMLVPSNTDCTTGSGTSNGFILDSAGNTCETSSGGTILHTERLIAQAAAADNVRVFATPWTPPASMKSNSSIDSGGTLNSGSYQTWANYMGAFCALMQGTYGVPIYAISVQNEPDITAAYPSATWSAQNIHDFVPDLYTVIQSNCPGTQIMIAEQAGGSGANFGSDFNLTATAMGDSAVAPKVGILAAHGYTVPVNGTGTINAPSITGTTTQHVWETETSTGDTYAGTMTNALLWAPVIYDFFVNAGLNGFVWWGTDGVGDSNYDQGDNEYLTDSSGNMAKRAYVLAQWARFVRPGWYLTGGTVSGNLYVASFKQPTSGAFAIIATNTGSAVSNQVFNFSGFTCGTQITVWQTDASNSLTQQASIVGGGSSITYTIPTDAVLTFSGHADGYRLGQLAAKVQ